MTKLKVTCRSAIYSEESGACDYVFCVNGEIRPFITVSGKPGEWAVGSTYTMILEITKAER